MLWNKVVYWYHHYRPIQLKGSERLILESYSSYYRKLDDPLKLRFEQRLAVLLKIIRFIPDGIDVVTEDMKIAIGSAIVQITFGYRYFYFNHFNTVLIAPRPYTYRGKNYLLIGDVNPNTRKVSLSWPHVQAGFKVDDDAFNVALHELAHCLEFEYMLEANFFNKRRWKDWQTQANMELQLIHANKHKLFHNYAGRNIRELFAVSIEYFFERPHQFKDQLPELYQKLAVLMRQDPTDEQNPLVLK